MADSIKEAEAEYALRKQGKGLDMTAQIAKLEKEANPKNGEAKISDANLGDRKKIDAMSQNMVDDALNTKSVLDFDGKELNVENIDGNRGAKEIIANQKVAIKEALKDRNNELGLKNSTGN